MVTALDIQPLLENRIAALLEFSRNQSATQGVGRSDSRARHWIQYEGSNYDDPTDLGYGSDYTQDRTLRFSHYVEVLDLQKDYKSALVIHEALIQWLSGYRPPAEGVLSPLVIQSDDLVNSAALNQEPRFRYRAQYELRARVSALPSGESIAAVALRMGIWRSPVDEVGDPLTSTKDEELFFETEVG